MGSQTVTKTKRKPTGAAAMGPGPGRPKGSVNKVTTEFRETVRKLLESNAENVGRWLTQVAEGDGSEHSRPDPAKALDLLAKLAEYAAPKLGRIEHVGDGGGPIETKRTASEYTDDDLAAIIAAQAAKKGAAE